MDKQRFDRVLALVILFLLSTTLFNTLRANRVEERTTSFRMRAQYELRMINQALEEQKAINARLEQTLDRLLAEQVADPSGD